MSITLHAEGMFHIHCQGPAQMTGYATLTTLCLTVYIVVHGLAIRIESMDAVVSISRGRWDYHLR